MTGNKLRRIIVDADTQSEEVQCRVRGIGDCNHILLGGKRGEFESWSCEEIIVDEEVQYRECGESDCWRKQAYSRSFWRHVGGRAATLKMITRSTLLRKYETLNRLRDTYAKLGDLRRCKDTWSKTEMKTQK